MYISLMLAFIGITLFMLARKKTAMASPRSVSKALFAFPEGATPRDMVNSELRLSLENIQQDHHYILKYVDCLPDTQQSLCLELIAQVNREIGNIALLSEQQMRYLLIKIEAELHQWRLLVEQMLQGTRVSPAL